MLRTFTLTLTEAVVAYNLLTLILAVEGAVPTDSYFPNPCSALDLQPDGAHTVEVRDSADGSGPTYTNAAKFSLHYLNNKIDLSKIWVKGSADGTTLATLVVGG
jgi:hypothetical protein